MDRAGSNSVPEVHERLGRVEHGYSLLGGDVVRRASILELVESGCDKVNREGLSAAGTDGLSRSDLPINAGLLAEGTNASAHLRQSNADTRQAHTEPGHAEKDRSEQVKHASSYIDELLHTLLSLTNLLSNNDLASSG